MRYVAGWVLGILLAGAPLPGQEPEPAQLERARLEAELQAEMVRLEAEKALVQAEMLAQVRVEVERAAAQVDRARAEAERARAAEERARRSAEASYERARRALDQRQWEKAAEWFGEVAKHGGSRADGALYWKAYAQGKLGRQAEAFATLAELQKAFPNSRWLSDAKALEVEIRQAAGQPVSPESETDEDIKLMALSGLANTEPERALPLLEKLLKGGQSPRVKERALFVLARIDSPRAKELIVQIAHGGSNPDLQVRALRYAGMSGKENVSLLAEVYASSSDIDVKRAALYGLAHARERDRILAIAREERTPELRREAIHRLGDLEGQDELWQLYTAESSVEIKEHILRAVTGSDVKDENITRLLEVARSDREPRLRRQAIYSLAQLGPKRTGDALAALYGSESDAAVRKALLDALRSQNNAPALIEIARKETDPNLKKEAVRRLSTMKSKEATEYMLEILNK